MTVVVLGGFLLLTTIGIAAIGGFDYWLYKKFGVQWTISRVMERLWFMWPWVPAIMGVVTGLLVGLLIGHFGWPQPPVE